MKKDTQPPETQNKDAEMKISVADIALLKQIVEVASQRGAFKANELTAIGDVYDRVSAWLETQIPAEDTDTESSDDENNGDKDA